MNFKEKIKQAVGRVNDTYPTKFHYGDYASHNLIDLFEPDQTEPVDPETDPLRYAHVFMLPYQVEDLFSSQFGFSSGQNIFRGDFLVLVKSDLDEAHWEKYYQEKYDHNIHGLENYVRETLRPEIINCELIITRWSYQQVINIFDVNMDGLLITYEIRN